VERGHGSCRTEVRKVTIQAGNKTGVRRATAQQEGSRTTTGRGLTNQATTGSIHKGQRHHSKSSKGRTLPQRRASRAELTTAKSQGPNHHSKTSRAEPPQQISRAEPPQQIVKAESPQQILKGRTTTVNPQATVARRGPQQNKERSAHLGG
jgi:hypothetical protein